MHINAVMTEAWLKGPVKGIPPLLMPVAHALVQAREDVHRATAELSKEQLWARPGGAASVGFHMMHLAGTLDRLLTYRHGRALSDEQFDERRREHDDLQTADVAALLGQIDAQVDITLENLRSTVEYELLDTRTVGRKNLPTNVLGLLFHAAEHTQRHAGQIVTTSIVVRGSGTT